MFRTVDKILNVVTMYRLVLYGLSFLALYALGASFFGFLHYSTFGLLVSLIVILTTSVGTNYLCAALFRVSPNVESQYITAFILFFILFPPHALDEYAVTISVAALAMASKYVLAYKRVHIVNPAAIALVVIDVLGRGEAFWWVGSAVMFVPMLIVGFLIVQKMQRWSVIFTFFAVSFFMTALYGVFRDASVQQLAVSYLLSGPALFFASVMLTEPATMPVSRRKQIIYGVIVGLLYGSQFAWGPFYTTPELALVFGNLFAYAVSTRFQLKLILKEKRQLATNLYEFVFFNSEKIAFVSGQYLEWTLPHTPSDTRGIRRYFTIASSPTEKELRLGVRIGTENLSTFKTALYAMKEGGQLFASSLGGAFTLPKDTKEKLLFIAGGIGVTPFRSQLKYLKDTNEKRDVILLYTAKKTEEFAYRDIFDDLASVGVKVVYVSDDGEGVVKGPLTKELLKEYAPDFADRIAYISGPHGMVTSFEDILASLGVPRAHIKTDFFPGFV